MKFQMISIRYQWSLILWEGIFQQLLSLRVQEDLNYHIWSSIWDLLKLPRSFLSLYEIHRGIRFRWDRQCIKLFLEAGQVEEYQDLFLLAKCETLLSKQYLKEFEVINFRILFQKVQLLNLQSLLYSLIQIFQLFLSWVISLKSSKHHLREKR